MSADHKHSITVAITGSLAFPKVLATATVLSTSSTCHFMATETAHVRSTPHVTATKVVQGLSMPGVSNLFDIFKFLS